VQVRKAAYLFFDDSSWVKLLQCCPELSGHDTELALLLIETMQTCGQLLLLCGKQLLPGKISVQDIVKIASKV
jgi:hypothetical protein